jgi:hypothetical protein
LFGKPGHGAPTEEIRKRRFTEYQLSDGTDNIPAENGDGSGLYSAYPVAMDDSCIPNRRYEIQINQNESCLFTYLFRPEKADDFV